MYLEMTESDERLLEGDVIVCLYCCFQETSEGFPVTVYLTFRSILSESINCLAPKLSLFQFFLKLDQSAP